MITESEIKAAVSEEVYRLMANRPTSAVLESMGFERGIRWGAAKVNPRIEALEAENAALREALKECVELIESVYNAFPTRSAPKVLRMAKETLRK